MDQYYEKARAILELAGVTINGKEPWDLQVHNDGLYQRTLAEGSLGFGEAYMDGWWDATNLDEFFTKILSERLDKKVVGPGLILLALKAKLMNTQSQKRSFKVGEQHYDAGNDLYGKMLDERMVYTCGYWKDADNLDDAQRNKLDLVCKKIGLEKGMNVLDIGCGWGSFAKFAAEEYGAKVTGVTISREQVKLGTERCKGLDVELKLMDYRDVHDTFDRVVSLGMFEHVGYKNYRTYMEVVERVLDKDGMFLLHTIGGNTSGKYTDPWIEKYIFPNSMIPSAKQITEAYEGLFVMEDWHNFGPDYDKTLMAWYENFEKAWPSLSKHYDERFYRMWKYYLLSCAGSFRARVNQLWQIVLTKKGISGGYISIR